jgi:hypothetical protein
VKQRRSPLETQSSKLSPYRLGVLEEGRNVFEEDEGGLEFLGDSDEFRP